MHISQRIIMYCVVFIILPVYYNQCQYCSLSFSVGVNFKQLAQNTQETSQISIRLHGNQLDCLADSLIQCF